VKLKE